MTSMLAMKTYRRRAQIRYGISPQIENPDGRPIFPYQVMQGLLVICSSLYKIAL